MWPEVSIFCIFKCAYLPAPLSGRRLQLSLLGPWTGWAGERGPELSLPHLLPLPAAALPAPRGTPARTRAEPTSKPPVSFRYLKAATVESPEQHMKPNPLAKVGLDREKPFLARVSRRQGLAVGPLAPDTAPCALAEPPVRCWNFTPEWRFTPLVTVWAKDYPGSPL